MKEHEHTPSTNTPTPGELSHQHVLDGNDSVERVILEFERDSDSLWRDNRLWAIATLFGPAGLTITILVGCAIVYGADVTRRLVVTGFLTFFMLGRFVILGGRELDAPAGFTPAQLSLIVFYLDVMMAIIISWHAGALFRIPWLGKRLWFLMQNGRLVLAEKRWMRHATFLSIVAFVMFPLASSGSVGGSLFGRLMGLSRSATMIGVLIGSLLGCSTMYFGAKMINHHIGLDNPIVRWGGVVAIVALFGIMNRRYRRAKRSSE